MSDEDINAIRADNPGMSKDCLDKMRRGGIAAMPAATDQCFRMTKPTRWRGLWASDFELSRFCPAPAAECSYETPGDQIWLSSAPSAGVPKWESTRGHVYAVDFLGRVTADRGHFGHLGMADREIIVDRMISMEPITEREK